MVKTSGTMVSEIFGQPEPPKNGRERLLVTAIDLFYCYRFGAFGIDQVIEVDDLQSVTVPRQLGSRDHSL